jgi:glycosyltransferase involved in cell wall biosynthesis
LQKCSVFLFPSIGEHFGIAPVEAMACGKAVVGHRSGGTVETVGQAGILCGDNVDEWVKAIKDLMENEERRKEIGRKSAEVAKQFTWDNAASRILDILEKM